MDRITSELCGLAFAALAMQGCGSGNDGGAPALPQPTFVSAPDCPGPGNIIAEEAVAPLGVTFMRVQNMGDPGTPEFAGEIANVVTWAVGDYTGFHPPDPAATGTQRGFRNEGPPTLANAFQLACDGAGFLVNTWQFSHSVPLIGEGPNVSIARDFVPGRQVFLDGRSIFGIEADIDLRHAAYQAPHVADGTAHLGFFYYAQDLTTGTVLGHVIGIFDSRAPGVGGALVEQLGHDGFNAFAFSPLLAVDGTGAPVAYVRIGPGSSAARSGEAWRERVRFNVQIPYPAFAALLARLRSGPLPAISPRPEDYRVGEFGVLGEVFPGTGSEHNVAIGASVFNLRATGG
jgi:hypothetical protein